MYADVIRIAIAHVADFSQRPVGTAGTAPQKTPPDRLKPPEIGAPVGTSPLVVIVLHAVS
ncbi:MAG TPA: hypothetical protein VE620_06525 [Myxococcales bacterium]|nr:hypothetical protein [Myxococcales bacterium]